MKYNKLLKIWLLTLFVLGIIYGIQIIIKDFFSENYLGLFMNYKQTLFSLVFSTAIFIFVAFTLFSKNSDKYVETLRQNNLYSFLKVISYIICAVLIGINLLNVVGSFYENKNVNTINGKVSKIQKISDKTSGRTIQVVTIIDTHNKKHMFIPSEKIKNFNVDKKDKVEFDYLPQKKEKNKGVIVGYKTNIKY
ncbi:TPA: hypothetical protein PET91_002524 [Staphylococcus aureus]|uniref:hypothetical protein n=1 Tax=Staphylococcus aureus TaxID=1280 RepID=UPI0004480472|nr:hypothetical protein [Staphylococcus aureus]EWJ87748.1 hypothetical protein U607_02885 [Staphylococcus aureus F36687]EWT79970.1 hypothetical protein V330_02834 [Staphylococcus aureus F85609]EWV00759.1 hypothetical protein U621_02931 [Staphylococcus aureus F53393]HCU7577753.1 hypothetical protein [Staphylococcus aureus]HCZ7245821.1 hypothetical protein [Staphylococcus aureus]